MVKKSSPHLNPLPGGEEERGFDGGSGNLVSSLNAEGEKNGRSSSR
jgi:hypothetical protein